MYYVEVWSRSLEIYYEVYMATPDADKAMKAADDLGDRGYDVRIVYKD